MAALALAPPAPYIRQAEPTNRLYETVKKMVLEAAEKSQLQQAELCLAEQLLSVADTTDNWDGYGSPAPSATAITLAQSVFEYLRVAKRLPTRVMPSAEGGIAFCFSQRERYADIELLNSGDALAVVSQPGATPSAWELDPHDPVSVRATVTRINQFFGA